MSIFRVAWGRKLINSHFSPSHLTFVVSYRIAWKDATVWRGLDPLEVDEVCHLAIRRILLDLLIQLRADGLDRTVALKKTRLLAKWTAPHMQISALSCCDGTITVPRTCFTSALEGDHGASQKIRSW